MKLKRKELRKDARSVLKKTYFIALIMSIILCIAGGRAFNSGSSGNDDADTQTNTDYSIDIPTDQYGLPPLDLKVNDMLSSTGLSNSVFAKIFGGMTLIMFAGAIIIAAIALFIISSLFRLLIGYQLEIGVRGYFVDAAEGRETGLGRLKLGFRSYGNVMITMFMRSLYTALWTLLLIIPGVIKSYSYMMVPYILADNPEIERGRAIRLSMDMTNGYKFQLFVLQLSFIGWYILGMLLFVVGQVLVWPYYDQTLAQAYLKLRENAINEGITTFEELGLDRAAVDVLDMSN